MQKTDEPEVVHVEEAVVEASARDGPPAVKTTAVEPEAVVADVPGLRRVDQKVFLLQQPAGRWEVLWAYR